MKYLVFAVFGDGGELATHSKEWDSTNSVLDKVNDKEKIIDFICEDGNRDNVWEIFVFRSANNREDAPVQIMYLNQDDILR